MPAMKAAQTNKHNSETINRPLRACFDLHPESGAQPCFKSSHCLFLFHSRRASRTKASRLPRILKQITSTLTSINTLESREWAGQIKHHRDPDARCLFWWAVIMFSWRQQTLSQPEQSSELEAALWRWETWTICRRHSASPFNYFIQCMSVLHIALLFKC